MPLWGMLFMPWTQLGRSRWEVVSTTGKTTELLKRIATFCCLFWSISCIWHPPCCWSIICPICASSSSPLPALVANLCSHLTAKSWWCDFIVTVIATIIIKNQKCRLFSKTPSTRMDCCTSNNYQHIINSVWCKKGSVSLHGELCFWAIL